MIVFKDSHFSLEHPDNCGIPGYLILRPLTAVNSLSDLAPEALTELGPLMARAMAAIQKVTSPERIYVLRFGEEVEAIHFHLFPRFREMAALYKQLHPSQPVASGAQMFDWVRQPEVVATIGFVATPDQVLEQLRAIL